MIRAIKQFFLALQLNLLSALQGTKARLAEERGDTNFISIAIVLVVILVIAGIFVTFGRQISTSFSNAIREFMEIFNS